MPPITVNIFGEEYVIRSNDDPSYTQKVALYVDQKMREIAESGGVLPPTKVAILAALNITDEFFRFKDTSQSDIEAANRSLAEIMRILDKVLQGEGTG